MNRRELLSGAAALAVYSQIESAEALTAGQRATLLGSLGKTYLNWPTYPSFTLMRAKQLSDFFGTAGVTYDGQVVTDPSNPFGYGQSIQIGGNGFNTTTYLLGDAANLSTPINMSGGGSIVMAYKPIQDWDQNRWGQFQWEVYSAGTPAVPGSDAYIITGATAPVGTVTTMANASTPGRWQYYSIHTSQWETQGLGADWSSIKRFRLRYRGNAAFAPGTYIGDVRFFPDQRTRGAVILAFDDEYASGYTIADPLFVSAGQGKATMYPGGIVSATGLNTSNKLTSAQLQAWLATGRVQLGTQTATTESKTTFDGWTDAQRNAEAQLCRSTARSFGAYPDSADASYFSAVGASDLPVFNSFFQNFRSARLMLLGAAVNPYVLKYAETFPFGDRYLIRAIDAAGTGYATVTAGLNAAVDGAAATKGVCMLVFHDYLAAGGGGFTAQNFVDGLTSILARTDVDFVTMKDLVPLT